MKKTILKGTIPLPSCIIIIVGVLLSLPNTAAACTQCIFSSFDYALPYTNAWCLGMMAWYCAVKVSIGRPLSAALWSFLAFIAAAAFIGPWAFVFLGGMAFCATVKASPSEEQQKLSRRSRIALLVVTIVAFTSIPVGLVISMKARAARDDVAFILQQNGWNAGRIALDRLLADPEKNERQLREIMAQIQNTIKAKEIGRALAEMEQRKGTP